MTTYKMLVAEFERKIKELQKNCPHKKTEKATECWAIGHTTGRELEICKRCNKTVSVKGNYWWNDKELIKKANKINKEIAKKEGKKK